MSEQKRRAPTSETSKETSKGDPEGSKEDVNMEASNTKTSQPKVHTIEQAAAEGENDTTTTTTTSFTDTTSGNIHPITEEETDLTMKVRRTGDAFYDLMASALERAKSVSMQKAKEIASGNLSPSSMAAKEDAQDIDTLGPTVADLARTFEGLMTEIEKQPNSEQVPLLRGYKKLLEEQINVVDSHIHMSKRLKSK